MEMPGISDPILQSTLGGGNLIRRCPCAQSAWGCCQGSLAPGKQTLPALWMLKYSCSVQGCRCWWHEPGTMPKQNTPRARVGGGRLPAIASGMAIADPCFPFPWKSATIPSAYLRLCTNTLQQICNQQMTPAGKAVWGQWLMRKWKQMTYCGAQQVLADSRLDQVEVACIWDLCC